MLYWWDTPQHGGGGTEGWQMATKIKVQLGYTVNMKQYESLRVDFGIEDDLRADEQVQQGIDRVRAVVEQNLTDTVAEVRQSLRDA